MGRNDGFGAVDRAALAQADLSLEIADTIEPRLVLRDLADTKTRPLEVDFLDPSALHRLENGVGKNQLVARALGLRSLKPENAPFVIDATAGLGLDAFFIAAHGCRVRALERSPAVAALLADGYLRLTHAARTARDTYLQRRLLEIAGRLSFEHGDARTLLADLVGTAISGQAGLATGHGAATRPDVVYLDPMYPSEGRSESALPKKGMQMLKRLLGTDDDAAELFFVARRAARQRVIVKRPLYAPPLAERPTHSFAGKTARLDMYLSAPET